MFSQTRLILVREKSENLKFLKSGRPAFSQSSNLDVSLGSDIPWIRWYTLAIFHFNS